MFRLTCNKNGLNNLCFLGSETDQRNGYAFVLLRVTNNWQTLTLLCGNDRKCLGLVLEVMKMNTNY